MGTAPEHDAPPISPMQADGLFSEGQGFARMLVAVSGGPDSMALAGLLARWVAQGPQRPVLFIATVNHGLRPEAAAEAAMVAGEAARLGLPHATLPWTGEKPATGLQQAARAARYDLLITEARHLGCEAIATAHTMDDQAETVLMRLASGSGPAGLAGMEPMTRRGNMLVWRPLLGVRKARLIATCEALGMPYVADPANDSATFARGRLRSAWAALEAEGLTAERLARFARRQGEANLVIDAAARQALGRPEPLQEGLVFPAGELWRALPAVQVRALAYALDEARARLRLAGGVARQGAPVALEKTEAAAHRLDRAFAEGRVARLTLGGIEISLSRKGALRLVKERPRRSIHRDRPLSLGKGGDEA